MKKKIIFIICGSLVLFTVIAFFKPIIPMQWTVEGIVLRTPYRATWQSVYYRIPPLSTVTGEIEGYNKVIPGATIRNTITKGKSLVTTDAVYIDGGVLLTGADTKTYVSVDYLIDGYGLMHVFGYDNNNLYVDGKIIVLSGDTQPFEAYRKYIKSL